jgi:hypothetical protein
MLHGPLFSSAILEKYSLAFPPLAVYRLLGMELRPAVEHINDAAEMPFAFAAVGIDIAPAHLPFGTEDKIIARAILVDMFLEVLPSFDRIALIEAYGLHERHSPLTHNSHGHGHRNLGCVLEGVAEILTWAEKGMPRAENRRPPLLPNSNLEKSEPGLTFLAFRRARYSIGPMGTLEIAWK